MPNTALVFVLAKIKWRMSKPLPYGLRWLSNVADAWLGRLYHPNTKFLHRFANSMVYRHPAGGSLRRIQFIRHWSEPENCA